MANHKGFYMPHSNLFTISDGVKKRCVFVLRKETKSKCYVADVRFVSKEL